MNKIQIKHPDRDQEFATGAYTDGIIAGGFLFVSGQAAVDFKHSKFDLGDIEHETKLTMDNIKSIVKTAGASMEDVVKSTVYLADIHDFDRYNRVYSTYFTESKPARTTVQAVLAEGIRIEIDCIVRLPG